MHTDDFLRIVNMDVQRQVASDQNLAVGQLYYVPIISCRSSQAVPDFMNFALYPEFFSAIQAPTPS